VCEGGIGFLRSHSKEVFFGARGRSEMVVQWAASAAWRVKLLIRWPEWAEQTLGIAGESSDWIEEEIGRLLCGQRRLLCREPR